MKLFALAVCGIAVAVAACAQDSPATRHAIAREPSVSVGPTGVVYRPARPPGKFNAISTSRPVIALTFDDGPHPELTPKLLDILREKGVRATFFVIGGNVDKYPEIARRIVAEGHEIANHSYSHPALTGVGPAGLYQELKGTSDAILRATGRLPRSMRPPYGANNAQVERAVLQEHGMDMVMWSVDPLDWKRPGAAVVTKRLVDGARPGAILLAHDIHPGTVEAIPEVISQLKAKGYTFVTVGQLFALQDRTSPKVAQASFR